MSVETSLFTLLTTKQRVLCLDDDAVIAKMVGDVVRHCGHDPVTETDPLAAIVSHVRGGFAAVITDLYMPKITGLEVLMAFEQSSPKTRRILLTAASPDEEIRSAVKSGLVHMLISKPPTINDIRTALAWL